jgi:glycine/D-amino acid oxidase-like deaminating enzyme/nitrite reductase/ring-hydroxylating ferredoxin subunit
MNHASGATVSYWMNTASVPSYQPLSSNEQVDVCVIGGGIAGLTTSYLLARAGVRVLLLEDGTIASGETGRTTAHITNVIDDRYYEIERVHGERAARIVVESQTAAIDRIEQIVKEENIDCAFTRVPAFLFFQPDQSKETDKEMDACAKAGLPFDEPDASLNVPRLTNGRVMRFSNQAQFHAMKYMSGLSDAAARRGARICTGAHVTKVNKEKDHVVVETSSGYAVTCKDAVVATNIPITDLVLMHIKQAPYRTYVVAGPVPKGSVPLALYWDNLDPYHYVRLQPEVDRDILIVGGEDHKTGQADDMAERFAKLEEWTRARFPMIQSFDYRWSGQVVETSDGLGYIGHEPEKGKHVYVITGDSGMGMTHGTLGAMIVTDLITGRDNPWADVYGAGRLRLKAAGEIIKEDANMASQYVDYVTPGDVKSVDEIPAGEGRLLRKGLRKLAVFKNADGTVDAMSAVCTHLGCIVQWNGTEKSWDCPCHGSRFDPHGLVLNGPAVQALKKVNLDKDDE